MSSSPMSSIECEAERIIRLVAAHVRREVTDKAPIVSAELPETGERFEGVMPPVSTAPCFSIRKPATRIHTLLDYVRDGIMPAETARLSSLAERAPSVALAPYTSTVSF